MNMSQELTYEVDNRSAVGEPSRRAVEKARSIRREICLCSAVLVEMVVARVENRVSECENGSNGGCRGRNGEGENQEREKQYWSTLHGEREIRELETSS